jgi:pimeloyl-ACP methyl ester carboxylesterase
VARLLRAAGHEVHTPTLTGLGERAHLIGPEVGLDTHITDVVNLIRFEGLTDVILGGHSYGGMVITGVADRVPDRIRRLAYLDAAHPANGQSLSDVTSSMMEMARSMGEVVDGVELVLLPFPGCGEFYGVTDPADIAWMDERLTAHPWKSFADKLHLADEARMKPSRGEFNCGRRWSTIDDDHARQRRRRQRRDRDRPRSDDHRAHQVARFLLASPRPDGTTMQFGAAPCSCCRRRCPRSRGCSTRPGITGCSSPTTWCTHAY